MSKENRDIEKTYTTVEFIAKLRRLADSLEAGKQFEIHLQEKEFMCLLGQLIILSMNAVITRKKLSFK